MTRFDFEQEIEALFADHTASTETLAIWGGAFAAAQLADFLSAWEWNELDIPWRIWEWASDITFEYQTGAPTFEPAKFRNLEWLERVRFFGPHGDLELRRDGDCFLWHFVGEGQRVQQPHGFRLDNYRDTHTPGRFHVNTRTVLLWGQEFKDHPGQWQENRVAAARLCYPNVQPDAQGRVRLRYREYLYGGNVEAVWWLGLEQREEQNG